MSIELLPIAADPAAREAFAQAGVVLGGRVVAGEAERLPRFLAAERALLDPAANDFLRHGRFQGWIARVAGRTVGRVAAMIEPQAEIGFIGLYEAEDDPAVAQALLEVATGFLADHGCRRAWAPVDFSIFQGYRCQTSGFDQRPFLGEPRNPHYYPAHFAAAGFLPLHRWDSHVLERPDIEAVVAAYDPDYRQAEAMGYRFEPYAESDDQAALRRTWDLVEATYHTMPGYRSPGWEAFHRLYQHLPRMTDRDASAFLVDPGGHTIGFNIVLKDLYESLRAMRGQTGLLAKLRFKLREHVGPLANAYQTGILYRAIKQAAVEGRRHHGRPLALGPAIYCHGARRILAQPRYRGVVVALLREDTPNVRYVRPWASRTRTYHLYEKPLREAP